MDLTLSPREQSAVRRVLLAEHDPAALLSSSTAEALGQLIPCDVLMTGEGDRHGFILRAGEWPDGLFPYDGPQVCDGPLDTGLQHFAAMPRADGNVLGARAMGITDVLRLGFATRAGTVVSLSFDRCAREFTSRDVAMLAMLAPALGRLLRASPAGSGSASLTASERRVLGLVAEGLSNRQAAEELFVVEATVRKHLENAYRKLGVANRAAAVAVTATRSTH